ncbi:MAG: AMP-dependent synthetase/ligase [Micrococcales bacterium]|nr:AMP-dependent synthetase/ligase [Micrococcales bacterium]
MAPQTTEGHLGDLPARNAQRQPHRAAFTVKGPGGQWSDITASEFAADVASLARGLVGAGIAPGDRVGIMSATRYEWTLVDFALWAAGAAGVPIYESSSAEQIQWILSDSGATGVFLEKDAHVRLLESVRDELPSLTHVWRVDDLRELREAGSGVSDDALAAARAGQNRDSLATIIYTSGTTGRPKGCELTHGNFLDLCENTVARLGTVVSRDGASTLLFLPIAHVFARYIQVLCVEGEARMGHSADIKNVLDDFAAFRPTFILAVPRVFEKIYNSSEAKASGDGKGAIFHRAAATAIAYSRAMDGGRPGLALRAQHKVFDKLVYSKLRAAMGGQVEYAVSGGAPLGERLGHFFRGIGVTILEGYGLTETTAPLCVNVPERIKIGTVGPPLPGTSVRVADDGEILVQGVGVFRNYHDNAEATASAISDGWFHTGDLGELDEDGYLRITGRKKEILVTAGGKNVAPAVLEDRLRAHPLVSQCMVVGDGKPFIGALVTLDEEMLPTWAANHGLDGITLEQALDDPTVHEHIQEAVDRANKAVSKAESIRKWRLIDHDFTEETGHLTPSLKLRRAEVMRDYNSEVESLYS